MITIGCMWVDARDCIISKQCEDISPLLVLKIRHSPNPTVSLSIFPTEQLLNSHFMVSLLISCFILVPRFENTSPTDYWSACLSISDHIYCVLLHSLWFSANSLFARLHPHVLCSMISCFARLIGWCTLYIFHDDHIIFLMPDFQDVHYMFKHFQDFLYVSIPYGSKHLLRLYSRWLFGAWTPSWSTKDMVVSINGGTPSHHPF